MTTGLGSTGGRALALACGLCLLLGPLAAAGQLPAGGVVRGLIEDPSGAVVPGVVVTAICGDMRRAARSNSRGVFEIDGLPPRSCLVTAESTTFASS